MGWPSGARLLVALVVALVHAALLCALVTARIPHADLRALEPREIRAALGEKAPPKTHPGVSWVGASCLNKVSSWSLWY